MSQKFSKDRGSATGNSIKAEAQKQLLVDIILNRFHRERGREKAQSKQETNLTLEQSGQSACYG